MGRVPGACSQDLGLLAHCRLKLTPAFRRVPCELETVPGDLLLAAPSASVGRPSRVALRAGVPSTERQQRPRVLSARLPGAGRAEKGEETFRGAVRKHDLSSGRGRV